MSKLNKLLSAAVLAVVIAAVVVVALNPATVEAAGGKKCWWSAQDHNRVELLPIYDTQSVAKTYCGSGYGDAAIIWVEKVGSNKNICRF